MSGRDLDPVAMGKRITELRKKAGMTQEDLAKELSLGRVALNYIEKGRRALKDQEIVLLANTLETSCDYLLTGIETKYLNASKELGLTNSAIENIQTIEKSNLRMLDIVLGNKKIISTFNEMLADMLCTAKLIYPVLQKKYGKPALTSDDEIKDLRISDYYTLHAGRCTEHMIHQVLSRKNPYEGLLTEKEMEEYEQEEI